MYESTSVRLAFLSRDGILAGGYRNVQSQRLRQTAGGCYQPRLSAPRVALSSTATTSNAVASPATGLMVYNTATAGTSPNNVTPGFYFYDGSKWQRIINQQPDATVSFSTADPNTGSPTFDPRQMQPARIISM